jgi:hypothetical protein
MIKCAHYSSVLRCLRAQSSHARASFEPPEKISWQARPSNLIDLPILLSSRTSGSILFNLFIQNRSNILQLTPRQPTKYLLPVPIRTTHRQHIILDTTRNTQMIQHNLPSTLPSSKRDPYESRIRQHRLIIFLHMILIQERLFKLSRNRRRDNLV